MSWETTMICDGCSEVIGGGAQGELLRDLRANGGVEWRADGRDRHLCGRCVRTGVRYTYDEQPVPALVEP